MSLTNGINESLDVLDITRDPLALSHAPWSTSFSLWAKIENKNSLETVEAEVIVINSGMSLLIHPSEQIFRKLKLNVYYGKQIAKAG